MSEEEIDAEIESFRKRYPEDWRAKLLNNFYFNFPTKEDGGWYHEIFVSLLESLHGNCSVSAEDVGKKLRGVEREVKMLDAVDAAMVACGVPLEQVCTLTSMMIKAKIDEQEMLSNYAQEAFGDLVLPVYRQLRRQGYSRESLIS